MTDNQLAASLGYASIMGPVPVSFATQMLAGKEGAAVRRRSSAMMSMGSVGMKPGITGALAGLTEADLEEDSDDDDDDDQLPSPHMGGRRASMSKVQMKQYGVFDAVTESMFIKTMGISKEDAHLVTQHTSTEDGHDLFGELPSLNADGTMNDPYNLAFESKFEPHEMRCLALVAHNHMKPAMKDFVNTHKEILRKFRLTGTNTTMTMLKDAFGDDDTVQFGPAFQSGPLGGDAELCALMCLEDLGACIFFQDPLSAHPHQADIDSLTRLCNVHNILTACNPCSAHALCFVLKCALSAGRKDKVPSFFASLKSPGVAVYKAEQKRALEAAKRS